MANIIWGKEKLESRNLLPTLKASEKLQSSRPRGTGQRKDSHQRVKIKSPEVGQHTYSQLIFDRGAKAIQMKTVFILLNGKGTGGHPCAKKTRI